MKNVSFRKFKFAIIALIALSILLFSSPLWLSKLFYLYNKYTKINLLLEMSDTQYAGEELNGFAVALSHDYKPLPYARVTFEVGNFKKTVVTNEAGMARITLPDLPEGSYQLKVKAWYHGKSREVFRMIKIEKRKVKIYLYSDRKIYKPGQEIKVAGFVWQWFNGSYIPVAHKTVALIVRDPSSKIIFKRNVITDDFGHFSLSFPIDKEAELGNYSFTALYRDVTEKLIVEVRKYEKPEAKLDILSKNWITRDDKEFEVKFKLTYVFGNPVVDQEIDYKVYLEVSTWREKNIIKQGSCLTDSQGVCTIKFSPEIPSYYYYHYRWGYPKFLVIEAKSKVIGVETSAIKKIPIVTSAFNVEIQKNKEVYREGDDVEIYVSIAYPDGTEASDARTTWKLVGFKIVDNELQEKILDEGASKGAGFLIKFRYPSGVEYVKITLSIDDGVYSAEKEIFLNYKPCWYYSRRGIYCRPQVDEVEQKNIVVFSDKKEYREGEDIKLSILAKERYRNEIVYVSVLGAYASDFYAVRLDNDAKAELIIKAKPSYQNAIIRAYVLKDCRKYSYPYYRTYAYEYVSPKSLGGYGFPCPHDEISIYVLPDKKLDVEIISDKKIYEPREEATIKFKVSKDNKPISALVSFAVIDKSVQILKENKFSPFEHYYANPAQSTRVSLTSIEVDRWKVNEIAEKLILLAIFIVLLTLALSSAYLAKTGRARYLYAILPTLILGVAFSLAVIIDVLGIGYVDEDVWATISTVSLLGALVILKVKRRPIRYYLAGLAVPFSLLLLVISGESALWILPIFIIALAILAVTRKDMRKPVLVCVAILSAIFVVVFLFTSMFFTGGMIVKAPRAVVEENWAGTAPKLSEGKGKGTEHIPKGMEIRYYFPDTALWKEIIAKDGTAEIKFKLPDSITTWQVLALAASKNCDIGSNNDAEVIAKKDFFIKVHVPNEATVGDEITISARVFNFLNESVNAYVTLIQSKKFVILDNKTKVVNLRPNEAEDVSWYVRLTSYGVANVTVVAYSGNYSDGVRKQIIITPRVEPIILSFSGVLESNYLKKEFKIYENAIPEFTNAGILIQPTLLSVSIAGIERLARYPYGCVEQTMSGLYPDIIIKMLLKEKGMLDKEFEKKLDDMVAKGLQRIYSFRHSDGGWGWWKDDATNEFMTAYVLFGLAKAKQAGFYIDDGIIRGAQQVLMTRQLGNGAWQGKHWLRGNDVAMTAYVTLALLESGVNKDDYHIQKALEYLKKHEDVKDAYTLSLIILTYEKAEIDASYLAERLYSMAINDHWHGKALTGDIETTACAIRALLATGNAKYYEIVQKAVKWIIEKKKYYGWYTTKDTAEVLLAIYEYNKIAKEQKIDCRVSIFVNGKEVESFTINEENKNELYTLDITDYLETGRNVIEIRKEGVGNPYYTIVVKQTTETLQISPEKDIIVEKSYSKTVAKVGDIVKVKIRVKGNDIYYVILEDYIPPGFEVKETSLKDELNENVVRYEINGNKISWFIDHLGEVSIEYELVARYPSVVYAKPAVAYGMYSDIKGQSNSATLVIEG